MPPTVLSRKAMYDLVWSKPMSKVAQDFGISDVALKKICRKRRVPTPPRGYWAKKEAGKSVKQPRFVETADQSDERITIFGSSQADLPEPVREVLRRARTAWTVRQPSISPLPQPSVIPIEQVHPAITATAKRLRTQKPDKDGVVSAALAGCCGVDIGSAHIERAIRILDTLARAFAAQGVELVPNVSAMVITSNGEKITFRLKEYVRRDKHVPTPDELEAEERRRKRLAITWDSPYGRAYPEWDFVRTGQLSLEIENQYVVGLRRTWKDGKHQRLEKLVGEIVAGILAYAVALQLRAEEQARRHRNYERMSRIRARARARDEREEQRQKVLDELVAISAEADKLRIWLTELNRWLPRPDTEDLTRFVEWARDRLNYLEHAVNPDVIAQSLKERELFPEVDLLIDPPEDLREE